MRDMLARAKSSAMLEPPPCWSCCRSSSSSELDETGVGFHFQATFKSVVELDDTSSCSISIDATIEAG